MSGLPVRRPAVAGQFYPDNPGVLRRMIGEYLEEAALPAGLGAVRAVIAPHAGYIYSGPIAGYAFKACEVLAALPTSIGPSSCSARPTASVQGRGPGQLLRLPHPARRCAIADNRVAEMLARSPLYVRRPRPTGQNTAWRWSCRFSSLRCRSLTSCRCCLASVDAQSVGADLADHVCRRTT